ncbi:MAG: hypothetical protein KOO63_09350 [Bacteroidales bacterium]|nr:hypothetical protein [Candidatus Latescibacterota bacterium]
MKSPMDDNPEHYTVTYVGKDHEGVKRRWYMQLQPDEAGPDLWTLTLSEALIFPFRCEAVMAVLCLGIMQPKGVFREIDVCPIVRGDWALTEDLYLSGKVEKPCKPPHLTTLK